MTKFFEQFAFHDPWWLLGLLILAPLFFLRNVHGSESGIDFPSLSILSSVGTRPRERAGRFTTLLFCLVLLTGILGLARPQWTDTYTARAASGIDILVALDVSDSMRILDFYEDDQAQAFRREKQRLTAAKEVIATFIEERPNDRIGMVAFAAQPYSVCPLTLDHGWLIDRLKSLQIGDLDANGTAIGSAIAAATTRLTDRNAKSKIVVLVTDGASNSGMLAPLQAAQFAAPLGVRVYTVAIGSAGGRFSRTDYAQPRQEYDAPTLREIARITNGEFYEAATTELLRETFSNINDLERSESKSRTIVDARELYGWCVGAAFVLAFLALSSFALNPPPLP
jgi:Ca-activated chloride channel family protein